MSEMQTRATSLRNVQRELDEAAEWIGRLADDLGSQAPTKLDLVGLAEVVEMTGINRSTVKAYKQRGQMPEPVAELAGGTIWLRSDIERWARER